MVKTSVADPDPDLGKPGSGSFIHKCHKMFTFGKEMQKKYFLLNIQKTYLSSIRIRIRIFKTGSATTLVKPNAAPSMLSWKLVLKKYIHIHNIILCYLKIETDIAKNAICDRETALESAMDGQDSPPPPSSKGKLLYCTHRSRKIHSDQQGPPFSFVSFYKLTSGNKLEHATVKSCSRPNKSTKE